MVFNGFYRALIDSSAEQSTDWPVTPVPLDAAVIVGSVGASPPNKWWQVALQDQADFETLSALPAFRGPTYAVFLNAHAQDSQEVLEAVVQDGDVVRRVKMVNKPATGVIEENVPPHFFAGVPA